MLPLLLGVATLGGSMWAADQMGVIELDDAGEAVGEIIGTTVATTIKAIPPVLEALGPALVDGISDSVTATRESLRGREVLFITGLTVILLGFAGWWTLKGITRGSSA
tara:strand:+ start:11324 stop:11647 length:324 start_codon:yes stop_codon:yes gene_type:complete